MSAITLEVGYKYLKSDMVYLTSDMILEVGYGISDV